MAVAKIAITIDETILTRLDRLVRERRYPNRSRAVQEALEEKIRKSEHTRLWDECAKLDPREEQRMAEEGIGSEKALWPEY